MNTQQNKNGEKSSEQDSHIEAKQRNQLKSQIRECYGRVVYSHKVHEKCSDILLKRNSTIKVWQIILSAITTGSFIATIFGDGKIAVVFGAFISAILLILNSYTKDFELVSIAEKHSSSANQLWEIREDYLSLLTDFDFLSIEQIINKRDNLQERLSMVYSGSPRTNVKAYTKAQSALKENEELTFSENEIDLMLPKELRNKQEENR